MRCLEEWKLDNSAAARASMVYRLLMVEVWRGWDPSREGTRLNIEAIGYKCIWLGGNFE